MTHTDITDTRKCPACIAAWTVEDDLDSESVPFVARGIMRQHDEAIAAAAERGRAAGLRQLMRAAQHGAPEAYRFR